MKFEERAPDIPRIFPRTLKSNRVKYLSIFLTTKVFFCALKLFQMDLLSKSDLQ